MTQNHPLAVDHSQAGATLRTSPTSTVLHSFKASVPGLYLESHYAPPHETPEHYPTQHVIAIHTEGTVQAERRLNGQFRHEQIAVGDVCIVPAHTRHWIRSEAEQGLILLSLDPTFLKSRLSEVVNPDCLEVIPHFAQPDPLIHQLGRSLQTALQADPMSSRIYVESLGIAVAAHLVEYYTAQPQALPSTNRWSQASIELAIDYINDHLMDDLSLEAIATTIGLSQYHFSRMFKKATGLTPWQYVLQQRIAAAKRLLAHPELSIAAISEKVGFANQNQFSTFFRKQIGVTPTAYRRGR